MIVIKAVSNPQERAGAANALARQRHYRNGLNRSL